LSIFFYREAVVALKIKFFETTANEDVGPSEIKMGLPEWFVKQGLDTQVPENSLFLTLPATAPENISVPVIELFLK